VGVPIYMVNSYPSIFRWLPEWEPQRAILINWPHQYSHGWDPVREAVNEVYLAIVKTVAMSQSIMIICYDIEQRNRIQRWLVAANVNLPRIRFFIIPSDDVWVRDYGPLTLKNSEQTQILHFQFNGWGGRYPAERDSLVIPELHNQSFFPQAQLEAVDFVLEGGSIETDGHGALLTTRSCLLAKNRNPGYSEKEIEQLLKERLGVQHVLWLDHGGLLGDDTDGHIDTLARFVNPTTICYTQCVDPTDPHFHTLSAMENQLRWLRNSDGCAYELQPLPLPHPVYSVVDGKQLPATYTKFLITNQLVLLPFYEDPQDEIAKNVLQSCFPSRQVIGIPCHALLENYGSLHGITMQIPV
jgi:agmatine/peptidylarginine deiminase